MTCLRLNIRSVIFIVITVLFHGVKHSEMAVNHMELQKKDTAQKDMNMYNNFQLNTGTNDEDITLECPSNLNCQELQYPCITCDLNTSCIYGAEINTTCKIRTLVQCNGEREFQRSLICRYCYQTDPWEHSCTMKANCNSVATPRQHYRTNCSVRSDIICLGRRNFQKKILCNWTGGYRWTTALVLSITLGGFGADRFYLGHWQEGIGKLFSFGGLGVWTLIDVILISLHYLGPADGSLFL